MTPSNVAASIANRPGMTVDEKTLVSMVEAIDAAVSPLEIMLFGSQARGDARPDSDVDLLVVVAEDAPRIEIAKRAYRALRRADRHPAGVDIVVTTPGLRRSRMLVPSSVIAHAMEDGILLRRSDESAA